jgi:hypothetical protein
MSDSPCVLITHALTSYAESLARVVAELRPCLDVRLLRAADLDAELAAHTGAIVVTDRLTPAIETHSSAWLLYYPDRQNIAIAGGRGSARVLEAPSFSEILATIDDLVARSSRAPLVPVPPPETAELGK